MRWFDAARETADSMIERFADEENGGFFTTSSDHEELIARRKDVGDHPDPVRELLRRLRPAAARGPDRRARLRGPCHRGNPPVPAGGGAASRRLRSPAAGGRLPPLHCSRGRPGRTRQRLRRLGEPGRAGGRRPLLLSPARRPCRRPGGLERPELLRERGAVEGRPAAYVCEHFACKAPVTQLTSWPRSLTLSAGGAEFHPRHALLRVSMKFGDRTRPAERQRIGRNCSISNGVTCTR